jgi:hypothetical protein
MCEFWGGKPRGAVKASAVHPLPTTSLRGRGLSVSIHVAQTVFLQI